MLELEDKAVNVARDTSGGKLEKELAKYDIKTDPASGLNLAYDIYDMDKGLSYKGFMIRADTDENLFSTDYLKIAELRHHDTDFNHVPTAQVRGVGNLAIYAAKILSLQIPELREKIHEIAVKKRDSYQERQILAEIKNQ